MPLVTHVHTWVDLRFNISEHKNFLEGKSPVSKKKTIGLCVITKDEEKNIARCIKSVCSIVDEIVVVDTGSSDNTIKRAEELNAEVYRYEWNNSFSNARNFAIGKMKSEWLLLLDADEALDENARDKLIAFVNTTKLDGAHFRVRNYTGSYCPDNYNLHSALRLLRNNGRYQFRGSIHEQICCDDHDQLYDRFETLDIIVHHYGYLDDVVLEKQKRKRNLPILEKELELNPGDAFTLFNLGNEYLSSNDYVKALDYYNEAKAHLEGVNRAFVPHLYFRMINCYECQRKYQMALDLIAEGLKIYPECTDYEHIRANIQLKSKRYTLAIASLEKCLKMGNAPASLEFISGCGTYRSAFLLGEIYSQLEDYTKALEYYSMTLKLKPEMYIALYRAGKALNKLYADKDAVVSTLFSYFADPVYPPNVIVGADILIGESLYAQAIAVLDAEFLWADYTAEFMYLKAKAYCFLGQLEYAQLLLEKVLVSIPAKSQLLPGMYADSARLYFSIGLSQSQPQTAERSLLLLEAFNSPNEQAAFALMYKIVTDEPPEVLYFENNGAAELETVLNILDIVLHMSNFELFERLLRTLNYIDSSNLLLRVSQVFWDNGFKELAADYVLRSIKELNTIDEYGVHILFHQIVDQPLQPVRREALPDKAVASD